MAEELTQEQIERAEQLAAARRNAEDKQKTSVAKEAGKVLGFPKKVAEHWLILVTAAFFDFFAMIPFISVAINACFGMILFIYFGPKGKGGELTKIALPVTIGSVVDFFLGALPVNVAATLIRIALD